MSDIGKALTWDSEIEKDGSDWTLLPEGVYPFMVKSFTRAHFGGSAKLPACPQAKLVLEVGGPEESTTIKHNLFLHSKTEGLLCEFFRAIGARKHGERLVMDWSKVPGANGFCKVIVRKYKRDDGTDAETNDIKKFLDPAEMAATPATAEVDDLAF